MVSAVIFDVDGTLVDSVDFHAKAWEEAFRHLGHELDFQAIRDQIGKGGDQLMPVFLPEERILFTGDLVEERCFAIVPYFPPDDTDVDGEKWIAVLDRLEGLAPEIVVPGHGSVGGSSLVREVRNYLAALRDEVRELQSAGVPVDAAVEQLDARMRSLHPDWVQPEWIGFGVRHFYEAG